MSSVREIQPGMGFIGNRSTPTMMLETGMFCWATCIQPPGAAHKSMHTRDFWRNSNLRFSWISLKAARDLKPYNGFEVRLGCDGGMLPVSFASW